MFQLFKYVYTKLICSSLSSENFNLSKFESYHLTSETVTSKCNLDNWILAIAFGIYWAFIWLNCCHLSKSAWSWQFAAANAWLLWQWNFHFSCQWPVTPTTLTNQKHNAVLWLAVSRWKVGQGKDFMASSEAKLQS